jgi:hypothetical protein
MKITQTRYGFFTASDDSVISTIEINPMLTYLEMVDLVDSGLLQKPEGVFKIEVTDADDADMTATYNLTWGKITNMINKGKIPIPDGVFYLTIELSPNAFLDLAVKCPTIGRDVWQRLSGKFVANLPQSTVGNTQHSASASIAKERLQQEKSAWRNSYQFDMVFIDSVPESERFPGNNIPKSRYARMLINATKSDGGFYSNKEIRELLIYNYDFPRQEGASELIHAIVHSMGYDPRK